MCEVDSLVFSPEGGPVALERERVHAATAVVECRVELEQDLVAQHFVYVALELPHFLPGTWETVSDIVGDKRSSVCAFKSINRDHLKI